MKTLSTARLFAAQLRPDGTLDTSTPERARHEIGPSETGMYSFGTTVEPAARVGLPGEVKTHYSYYLTAEQLEEVFVLLDSFEDAHERRTA